MEAAIAESTIVVLGASNVTLGWPRLIRVLAEKSSGRLTVVTANGMGRSYCKESSRFGRRELPGIAYCGIWDELNRWPSIDGILCTDIGNDLLFGAEVDDIVHSVETVLQRLQDHSPAARLVVTRPPLASVRRLSDWRFNLCRQILFPGSDLTLDGVQRQTELLDERVQKVKAKNLTIVKPLDEWYGLDPIHIRRRYQRRAFQYLLQSWTQLRKSRLTGRRATAAVRTVKGQEIMTEQPAVSTNDLQVWSY